jgi:hypothetical protein
VNPWLSAARQHGRGGAAVWSFLSTKYDADHDGKVVAKEYPRDAKTFARLDRDHDEALTAKDFDGPTQMEAYLAAFVWRRLAAREAAPRLADAARSGSSTGIPSPTPPAAAGPGTSAVPARPADDDEGLPDVETVRRAFARADRNRNGLLGESELDTALAEAQATPVPGVMDMPEGVRTFPHVLVVMDDDRSGRLSLAEVEAWLARTAAEEAAEKESARKAEEGARQAEARKKAEEAKAKAEAAVAAAEKGTEPKPADDKPLDAKPAPPAAPKRPSAPAVGAAAPDFTLKTKDGKSSVTLSSFRGKKPVAIVFGSYT